jgi:hypothetical protein
MAEHHIPNASRAMSLTPSTSASRHRRNSPARQQPVAPLVRLLAPRPTRIAAAVLPTRPRRTHRLARSLVAGTVALHTHLTTSGPEQAPRPPKTERDPFAMQRGGAVDPGDNTLLVGAPGRGARLTFAPGLKAIPCALERGPYALVPGPIRVSSCGVGHWGAVMLDKFNAQSLVETHTTLDRTAFELTFVDAKGARHTLRLSRGVAKDLVPVLQSLTDNKEDAAAGLTKMPKTCQVGHATYERLVLIKFDDDPPYAIGLEDARSLWRDLRQESQTVSRRKRRALQ